MNDKENDRINEFCEQIQKDLFNKNDNYRLLALAARWAELELREMKDSINHKNE
jgi:hypothetical protein